MSEVKENKKEQPKILHASERKKLHEDALKSSKAAEEKQRTDRVKLITDITWARLNKWLSNTNVVDATILQGDITISSIDIDPDELKKMIALAKERGYTVDENKNSDLIKISM